MKAILHTDGGARGNPGPAAIGYVLAINGREPITLGSTIGTATNNQAEYRALLAGLEHARREGVTLLECFLDSELVVKQLQGHYRIKNEGLRPYYDRVVETLRDFEAVTFSHVRREKNAGADKLVNQALDETKKPLV